MTETSTQAII